MSEIKIECESCEKELEATVGDSCITVYPCQNCLGKADETAYERGIDDGRAQGYDSGYEEGKQAGIDEAAGVNDSPTEEETLK